MACCLSDRGADHVCSFKKACALFKIDKSRGSNVLLGVLGEKFYGTLGCDYFGAYRKNMREYITANRLECDFLTRRVGAIRVIVEILTDGFAPRGATPLHSWRVFCINGVEMISHSGTRRIVLGVFVVFLACVCLFSAETRAADREKREQVSTKADKKPAEKPPKRLKPPVNPGASVPDDVPTREQFDEEFAQAEPAVQSYSIWRAVFGLAFVIGLILCISYLLRFMNSRGLRLDLRGNHIRIVDAVQIGMNRGLYLVQVGSKLLLVASTDKGLSYMTEITDPGDVESILGGENSGETSTFAGALKNAAGKVAGEKTASIIDKLRGKLTKMNDET